MWLGGVSQAQGNAQPQRRLTCVAAAWQEAQSVEEGFLSLVSRVITYTVVTSNTPSITTAEQIWGSEGIKFCPFEWKKKNLHQWDKEKQVLFLCCINSKHEPLSNTTRKGSLLYLPLVWNKFWMGSEETSSPKRYETKNPDLCSVWHYTSTSRQESIIYHQH